MIAGAPATAKLSEGVAIESVSATRSSQELQKLFRVAQNSVCFICRIKNIKYLKQCVDRAEIRKRPFRSREAFF